VYHEGAKMAKRTTENDLVSKIDAFTPDTLPLNVFAEYITNLVALVGDAQDVNFVRVGKGSAKLVQRVKQHALEVVRERIESIKERKGPEEALNAFSRVNALLVRDNAVATLSLGRSRLIEFPGRKNKPEPPLGPVTQPDLDGFRFNCETMRERFIPARQT
jgi:hypothetical protein